tara:strand:+ start:37 stop:789 length:753 start_codon:yes stop_codon:yes gene_type:complete
MAEEFKFPSEVIDLPSEGKVYPKDHPLRNGKIEIKYMTAREEDILTSQNLIKKGVVIEKLLDSLILTKGITSDDLILGDKNAVMVAARVLAYGPEYECEVFDPNTSEKHKLTINLANCPFKKLPDDINSNEFEIKLPVSKKTLTCKLLTGKEEQKIADDLKASKKIGTQVSPELTTRLRHTIVAIDGDDTPGFINTFVSNMLAKDSLHLRSEIKRITPDIELKQEVEIEGEPVTVDIPMTVNFFWPGTQE